MLNVGTSTTSKKNRGTFQKILSILAYVLISVIALATVALIYIAIQSRAAGSTPSIRGYQMLKVLSGSMEPAIHTGSVIIIKEAIDAPLKTGDIVTFRSAEYDSMLVTHRIIALEESDTGDLTYITRGDANDANDLSALEPSKIQGIMLFSIPLLGYVLDFMQSREGLLFLVIIPGTLLAVHEGKEILNSILAGKRKNTKS